MALYPFKAFSMNLTMFCGRSSDLSLAWEEKSVSSWMRLARVYAYSRFLSMVPCNFNLCAYSNNVLYSYPDASLLLISSAFSFLITSTASSRMLTSSK